MDADSDPAPFCFNNKAVRGDPESRPLQATAGAACPSGKGPQTRFVG